MFSVILKMHGVGVKMTSIILRSDNIWLKILRGKKSIFTSAVLWKEENTLEKSSKSATDKKNKKKIQQIIEWKKTDLALFGPLIKEKKTKKQKENTPSGHVKVENTSGPEELLPINLWNASSVKLNIVKACHPSKKGVLTTKNTIGSKDNKISFPIEFPKEPFNDVSSKQKSLVEKINNDTTFVENIVLSTAFFQKDDFTIAENIVPSTPFFRKDDITIAENIVPSTPFFQKDEIILPFPLVPKKDPIPPSSKEILTIASAKVDVPSVTQVLSKTMSEKSEMMLAMWRKRKIAEVGEEGLKEFMRESKLTGKELHLSIETYLRGVEYNLVRVEPRISGHWLSMKSILDSLKDVAVLESYVVHQQLRYKGFVDCVCKYKENLVVVEWKTSQRTKSTLQDAYDDPIQLAAYIGAINSDERYPFQVENALLVVAYPNGRPADVLTLDRKQCEHYWNEWLKRLETYNVLKRNSEE